MNVSLAVARYALELVLDEGERAVCNEDGSFPGIKDAVLAQLVAGGYIKSTHDYKKYRTHVQVTKRGKKFLKRARHTLRKENTK